MPTEVILAGAVVLATVTVMIIGSKFFAKKRDTTKSDVAS